MSFKNDTATNGADSALINLAPEVVENIVKQIGDRSDLSNTRLACKDLNKHASKELFSSVLLSPSEDRISAWNSISGDSILKQIPRRAIINTRSDMDEDGNPGDDGEEDVTEGFETALAALSTFPNLESLDINFTSQCLGERESSWWEEVPEDVARRKEMFTLIFQAINGRAADKQNRTIRKLTITNLQNCPMPDFTSSNLFRDVMAPLDELHISLIQESNEHGPDHDYTRDELRTFPSHFISDWLAPISTRLKALSIYSHSENWGPFPGKFDFSALAFPKLQRLALGYYTLAHDNDIDWILRIKRLESLTLHNAMIASWIRIDPANMPIWNPSTHDWTSMADNAEDSWPQWSYGGTWSTVLDRIRLSLPNLRKFAFDQGETYPWGEEGHYNLLQRDRCGVRIFPKRYVVFDNGILPTHWPEADDDEGELYSWLDAGWPINRHKMHLDADQKSLDSLLQTLKERQ